MVILVRDGLADDWHRQEARMDRAEASAVAADDDVVGADADRIGDAKLLDGSDEAQDVRVVQRLGP